MSTKRKAPSRIAAPVVKPSAKPTTRTAVDEKHADVTAASAATSAASKPEMIEISSDSGSDSEEDAEDEEDEEMDDAGPEADDDEDVLEPSEKRVNGDTARHDDADAATEGTESDSEVAPSFGDLLRSQQTIDVEASLTNAHDAGALVPAGGRVLTAPSASSLGTVLNQALRTDDTELLESCFATTDVAVVHNTIERLDSSLAGALLSHLATRLHRRPGRAGTLMSWVQWALVVHGGALAAQPDAVAKLAGLQKVLATRARGLNSLLILKGKLDLLEAQLKLRKRVQARQARRGVADEEEDDEEDENVIYVDGEGEGGAMVEDEDVDDVLLMNGVAGDSDDDEEGGAVEDESEGEESLDEDEVNFDDVDESMGEEDESDVEEAPPAKKAKGLSKRK